jgi:hypothetical protein
MKLFKFTYSTALAAVLGLGALSAAFGQSASIVQQSGTQLNAGTVCAVAANPQVATQNTLTFAVPSGLSFYLTSIYLAASQDATGAASSNTRFTTTNLQSMEWDMSMASAASTNLVVVNYGNPAGIVKSAQGPLNVTIVSPAATGGGAHTAFAMNACGYFAP